MQESGAGWKLPVIGVAAALIAAGLVPVVVVIIIITALSGASAMTASPSVPGLNAVVLDAYTRATAEITKVAPGCTGLSWSVLAGIGQVESGNAQGRTVSPAGDITPPIIGPTLNGAGIGGNTIAIRDTDRGVFDGDPVYDHAVGPMQFIPSSWKIYGQDGNADGRKNPQNIYDAALAAAAHLCGTTPVDLASPAALHAGILGYNHSEAYVTNVLAWAQQLALAAEAAAGGMGGTTRALATNPGSPFRDGPPAASPLPRANPRTVAQAIAWARLQQQSGSSGWYRQCLAFTALAYGWHVSGVSYAIDAYRTLPAQYRHDGDRNPPPGSLLFWDTGSRAGHVAVYVGSGMIATTDAPTRGKIGLIPAEYIERQWGARYVGWAPPYYPHGG